MADRVYLSLDVYRDLSVLDSDRIDELHARRPTFFDRNFWSVSRQIEDRLRHKYAVPFPLDHATIQAWITAIVDLPASARIGVAPTDDLFATVMARATAVEAQLVTASDLQSATVNLPLKDATDPSAISKGAPFGYAEASPYDCLDVQYEAVHG